LNVISIKDIDDNGCKLKTGLFSNPETVKMLNQNGMLDCSCLAITQEEADTRIILHALYSDKLYQENNVQGRIVVKSPDTDVLVLLVHYFPNTLNVILLIQFVRIQCMQNYAGIRLFLCACQTTVSKAFCIY
jgi:hypothetical protein